MFNFEFGFITILIAVEVSFFFLYAIESKRYTFYLYLGYFSIN